MKLTLVGAGPGDPDLITVKGIKALQQADVVMYDALVHPDLLDYCRPDALKVYVGKRRGAYSCVQEDINPLIVHYARQYGHVVRLKGGDSFVFGRGYEEIEYARQHGIETAVVPGLSSSYAVPAAAGVPLTTRGLSESFWVVTGTTKAGKLATDLRLAAQSSATVVGADGHAQTPRNSGPVQRLWQSPNAHRHYPERHPPPPTYPVWPRTHHRGSGSRIRHRQPGRLLLLET